MATTEASPRLHGAYSKLTPFVSFDLRIPDHHTRRRPMFSAWVRKITGLKQNAVNPSQTGERKSPFHSPTKARRHWTSKNNPYPESALPVIHRRTPPPGLNNRQSGITSATGGSFRTGSITSCDDSASGQNGRVLSTRSAAPTVATNPDTIHSDAGHSKAGTANTGAEALSSSIGRANSNFSSPQRSLESLTTTLTTLQSTAPSTMLNQNAVAPNLNHPYSPVHFTHQYPAPPTYLPPHLAPHPHTYNAAIANNMLTDNASVLTLASSSKRRRRHSLDTNASVRALAPSSLWGNSRESLPLSVLSANVETTNGINPTQPRTTVGGLASAERASVYSSSGVAPVANSERNSYYAAKQGIDGASVRSGLLGHGRTDSINGSITGMATSPLASPREAVQPGMASRRNSDWKDQEEPNDEKEVDEDEELRGEHLEEAHKVSEPGKDEANQMI